MALVERGPGGIGVAGASQVGNYGIQVKLPAIPLWLPEQSLAVLNQLTLNTLRLALQTVAGYVSDEAPVDSGLLAQSFGADPATQTGGIELLGQNTVSGISGRVFSSLPYAIVMDSGRRPGAPISREGIDAIGLWAQRKLGLSADQANRAKWAIAFGIVAQGIQGTGYFERGVNRARPTVEQMFVALGTEITRQLTGGRDGV